MYTEKQLRDELYEKVCQRYYVKMTLLISVAKGELTLDEFETRVREMSTARSPEELEKQISGAVSEVKSIMENVNTAGGIGKSPVEIAKELRKQSKGDKPSKEALDVILPYIQEHPDDIEAIETFGWVMYDFIKDYESDIDRYKKALSFLNRNVHFFTETIMSLADGQHTMLPKCYLNSFMRVIKDDPTLADRILREIIDFVGAKDDFLRSSDNELRKSSKYLYTSLTNKLNTENMLLLFKTFGTDWISSEDYRVEQSNNSSQSQENQSCFAERILYKYAKLLVDQSPPQEYFEMADYLITEIEYHNKKSGFKFAYADYHLAKLFLFIGNKTEAMKKALKFIPSQKKQGYAWTLLADCSERENKLAFLCAALLCGSPEDMKVGIQRDLIPLLVEQGLFNSAHFEVDAFEKTYTSKNDWHIPKMLVDSWKASDWYQTNKSAENREPLRIYAERATEILASYLPTIQIFTEFINKGKGAVSFLFKEGEYKQGYFYIDTCGNPDIKEHRVYTAKIEQNKKKPHLYNVYDLRELTGIQRPFIREDHGIVRMSDYGDYAFVSSSSLLDVDTFIPAELVNQYDLEEDSEIAYEKAMSWDKKKESVGWRMTRLIRKET